jgi:hypothetical protein
MNPRRIMPVAFLDAASGGNADEDIREVVDMTKDDVDGTVVGVPCIDVDEHDDHADPSPFVPIDVSSGIVDRMPSVATSRRQDVATSSEGFVPEDDEGAIPGMLDEDDCAGLHARYLAPRMHTNVELAGGMTLRRRCRGRVVDRNTPGYRMLRCRIDALSREGDRVGVYRLLRQLRDWEMNPKRLPSAFRDASGEDEDATEVFDMTNDADERASSEYMNVDDYIADVLLAPIETLSGFVVPPHAPSGEQVGRVPPRDVQAGVCNLIAGGTLSNASNCQDGKSASHRHLLSNIASGVQFTHSGIEELDAYAYSVIETLRDDCGFGSTLLDEIPTATAGGGPKNDSGAFNYDRISSPPVPCRAVDEKSRVVVKESTFVANYHTNHVDQSTCESAADKCWHWSGNKRSLERSYDRIDAGSIHASAVSSLSSSSTSDSNHVLLRFGNNTPKQGKFDAKHKYANWNEIPKPLGQLTIHDCRGFYVQEGSIGRQQFRSDKGQPHFTQHNAAPGLSSGGTEMPTWYNCALSAYLQNQVYVPLAGSQKPQLGLDPMLQHSTLLPPKSEVGTRVSDSLPSKSSNKTIVSQVVTPEGKRRKPRILKKNRKSHRVNLNPGKMLHFPKRIATFSVTDFGFPSIQIIPVCSRGVSYPTQSTRKSRNRSFLTKTSRQRDPFGCCFANRSGDLQNFRASPKFTTFSVIPTLRLCAKESKSTKTECLREQWNMQSALRRMGQWTPSGHVTGRWKPPPWAVVQSLSKSNDTMRAQVQKHKKNQGCRKSLLPKLDALVSNFSAEMRIGCNYSLVNHASISLRDVICLSYVRPTINLLCSAHSAVESLLPKGDCEDWEIVAMAWRYYNHWRPKETKVILLAESHAFTSKVNFCFVLIDPFR